jgi:hypothetical protein
MAAKMKRFRSQALEAAHGLEWLAAGVRVASRQIRGKSFRGLNTRCIAM